MDKYEKTVRFDDTFHAKRHAGFRKEDDFPVFIKFLKSYRPCNFASCETCPELREKNKKATKSWRGKPSQTIVPREVCILKRLESLPFVELPIDVFKEREKGRWVMIMEKQSPLDELGHLCLFTYKDKGFPLDVAIGIFGRLLQCICVLRDMGLAHGDLNGSNILWMVEEGADVGEEQPRSKRSHGKSSVGERRVKEEERWRRGNVRLVFINFGFAHTITDGTIKYQGSHPERYMPPEVYRQGGECNWEQRAVWELGHMLYEMLHGKRVDPSWLMERSVVDLEMRQDSPDQVKRLLLSCLEKDETKRANLEVVYQRTNQIQMSMK